MFVSTVFFRQNPQDRAVPSGVSLLLKLGFNKAHQLFLRETHAELISGLYLINEISVWCFTRCALGALSREMLKWQFLQWSFELSAKTREVKKNKKNKDKNKWVLTVIWCAKVLSKGRRSP